MAFANETVAANIVPLEGAIRRQYVAGSAITPGDAVCMSSDGYIDPADSDALATNTVVGIALKPRNQAAAYAAGDMVDVVVLGPVQCATGGTPGAYAYTSGTTAGQMAETAGTKSLIVGFVESATVVFVRPIPIALT
jgi:hypothetical protein